MIKLVMFVANADPSEKTRNIAIQQSKVAFLPKMSLKRPLFSRQSISKVLEASEVERKRDVTPRTILVK